jgi:hypothetical protein
VTLGSYGSVPVVGMTIAQAKEAVEKHLSQYFDYPEVAVDVYAYNSKVYYIVTQGAGLGDGVYRFPVTGNGGREDLRPPDLGRTVPGARSELGGRHYLRDKGALIVKIGWRCLFPDVGRTGGPVSGRFCRLSFTLEWPQVV